MTENRAHPFWKRIPSSYRQQNVVEASLSQNPNNAAHAIWRLGDWLEVEIYPNGNHWRTGEDDLIDDGRNDRGEPFILDVYAVTHPGRSNTITLPEGEHEEAIRTFYVDSNQPENKQIAKMHPHIFKNSYYHITGVDANGLENKRNHADIFIFNEERWEVKTVIFWNNARNEEIDHHGGVYEVVTSLYRHRSHELKAGKDTPGIKNNTYDDWKKI